MASRSVSAVLGGRYTLTRQLPAEGPFESWLAIDADRTEYLVKCWRYVDESLIGPARALWNTELRMLYRLASSRSAPKSLLVLKDAGVDREMRAFVMVLHNEERGYERFASALEKRQAYSWLTLRNIRNGSKRANLWGALERIAVGVESLHAQGVIHRCICAEQVFFDPVGGLESIRLGGFEWSIRLGFTIGAEGNRLSWTLPPEVADSRVGFTFDSDWYAFGMLALRCFFDVERLKGGTASDINLEALRTIEENPGHTLTELERDFLRRLIATEPYDRLALGQEVLGNIERIRRNIATESLTKNSAPLVLTFDTKNSEIAEEATESGFVPNPDAPREIYSPLNRDHVAGLKRFLKEMLRDARLFPGPTENQFLLVGRPDVTVLISPYRDPQGDGTATWDVAFIRAFSHLRTTNPKLSRDDLRGVELAVLEIREVPKYRNRQSWESYLPIDAVPGGHREVDRFHDFLRATNMIELLMCCAEIFEYRKIEQHEDGGLETLKLKETARQRAFPGFCSAEGGLIGYLQREIASGKFGCRDVLLTNEESLNLSRVTKGDYWTVNSIDELSKIVTVTRQTGEAGLARLTPDHGFIRTFGLHGNVQLIRRRKRAIDRINDHIYLLNAIAQPGLVAIDTGTVAESYPLPETDIDRSKQAIIREIERVRPVYALQGPPGTGKTTLVAWKLRRLFEEDPLTQVLVTAQAHGAVDVLRNKVRNEAFFNVRERDLPISIRLGAPTDTEDRDSVEAVGQRLLAEAFEELSGIQTPTKIQQAWLNVLRTALARRVEHLEDRFFRDFARIVKLSAGITYSTASAGDLAELAHGNQVFDWSFDWAIVEEAGKVHGFDLALPLQTGHRWLLLGDHKQLPPFKLADFEAALDNLNAVVRALSDLPDRAFLDTEWLDRWREDFSQDERSRFIRDSRNWLQTFGFLFEKLRTLGSEGKLTTTEPIGAHAGMLSRQYRMHPQIGDLISATFYDGAIENGTVGSSGCPDAKILHGLTLEGIAEAQNIDGKAILWIDVPWCRHDIASAENVEHRYTNEAEAQVVSSVVMRLASADGTERDRDVAILSPYTQQVILLNKVLSELSPRSYLKKVATIGNAAAVRWAHTVDSFQGNQADVVIVSLVRNNLREDNDALGFLSDAPRLNVLLSRAEKLLILVGSWEFFQERVRNVSLVDRGDRLWFWKKALTILEQGVAAGKVVRIPAAKLLTP